MIVMRAGSPVKAPTTAAKPPSLGTGRAVTAPGTDQVGTVRAISAEAGALLRIHEQRAPISPSSG